jgi:hypothetical protein
MVSPVIITSKALSVTLLKAARDSAVKRKTSSSAGSGGASGAPHRRQKRDSDPLSVLQTGQVVDQELCEAKAATAFASLSIICFQPGGTIGSWIR